MKNPKQIMAVLLALFVAMMSLPFLVPHTGVLALFGLVPLLCMERVGTMAGVKRMWLWHYSAFVLWNAVTTFWVCNATVGGGIFAVLANAFQMSLIFGTFRYSRKVFSGVTSYVFLALAWIAWEKYYLTVAQISWPWLVLGNSFAGTVSLVQWYEYFGSLGGSLWIWACNLGLFGLMVVLSDGTWDRFNVKAKTVSVASYAVILLAPMIWSLAIYQNYKETDDPLVALTLQPNIDPYNKFEAMPQTRQNAILMDLMHRNMPVAPEGAPVLVLAPETFTGDIVMGHSDLSPTMRRFKTELQACPNVNLLFGASTYEYLSPENRTVTARKLNSGNYVQSHNTAWITDGSGREQFYHKSKLVVAVEMTPYPKVFVPIDNLLGGVMGRCVGQDEVSLLDCVSYDADGSVSRSVPVGCAVCYESVYGEHCIEYVRKGARLLTVITNDSWWGNTPGYRQHLRYASLRAIETRRDIVRSANTGISAFINQRGDIVSRTSWWQPDALPGVANLNDKVTMFVSQGDIVGRLSVFLTVLFLLCICVRRLTVNNQNC